VSKHARVAANITLPRRHESTATRCCCAKCSPAATQACQCSVDILSWQRSARHSPVHCRLEELLLLWPHLTTGTSCCMAADMSKHCDHCARRDGTYMKVLQTTPCPAIRNACKLMSAANKGSCQHQTQQQQRSCGTAAAHICDEHTHDLTRIQPGTACATHLKSHNLQCTNPVHQRLKMPVTHASTSTSIPT
jgi:hypothetical protein